MRSRMMAAVRSKTTGPEFAVRKAGTVPAVFPLQSIWYGVASPNIA